MLIGFPVNPWISRTPVRPSGPSPPGKANGSAPGRTSVGAVGPDNGGPPRWPASCRSACIGFGASDSSQLRTDCDSALGLPSLAVHEGGVLFYWFLKFVAI